ncbi:MAG: hypothetical protein FJX77_10390, partial [Armatimonadetes bacterium]|nr:hypothetical protein [Armatimonadota bacterium]
MSSPASPPRAPVRPWISWRWIALLLLAAGSLLPVAAQQNQGAVPAPYPLDRVLVAFKEQAPLAARAATVARLGLQPAGQGSPYFAELKVNPRVQAPGAGQDPVKATLQALRRDPTVRIAEPDYRVRALAIPNDTRFGEQWGLHNVGQS